MPELPGIRSLLSRVQHSFISLASYGINILTNPNIAKIPNKSKRFGYNPADKGML